MTVSNRFSSSPSVAVLNFKDAKAKSVLAIDNSGDYALLAGKQLMMLIDLNDRSEIDRNISRDNKNTITNAKWSNHSSKFITSCVELAHICKWDREGYARQSQLKAHTRVITDIDWCESTYDGNLVATGSYDCMTLIWDLREYRKPATSLISVCAISQVKWHRTKEHTIATSHDGQIRVWDTRKQSTPVKFIAAHLSKISCIDWSYSNENILTSSSQDGTVKFWNINEPKDHILKLNCGDPVWQSNFTPFGEGLITVTVPQHRRENSLCLWSLLDKNSGRPGQSIGQPRQMHTFYSEDLEQVLQCQWKPPRPDKTDYHLVTWSKDLALRMWKIDENLQNSVSFVNESKTTNSDDVFEKPNNSKEDSMLMEEFQKVKTIIPMIIQEVDRTSRKFRISCRIEPYLVAELKIVFPDGYPVRVIPEFKFGEDSTIHHIAMMRMVEELISVAKKRVKNSQSCIEACMRHLQNLLTKYSESNRSELRKLNKNLKHQQLLNKAKEVSKNVEISDKKVSVPTSSKTAIPKNPMVNTSSSATAVSTTNTTSSLGSSDESVTTTAGGSLPTNFMNQISYKGNTNEAWLNDESIPFPRTSGARFCAFGYLVCFTRKSDIVISKPCRQPSRVGSDQTPRAMSALKNTDSRTTNLAPFYNFLRNQSTHTSDISISNFYNHKERMKQKSRSSNNQTPIERSTSVTIGNAVKNNKGKMNAAEISHNIDTRTVTTKSQKKPKKEQLGPVNLYDISKLLPVHKELGEQYHLDENDDIYEQCIENSKIAQKFGRYDLVNVWKIAGHLCLRNYSSCSNSISKAPPAQYVYGSSLVNQIFKYYQCHKDVQTLAMLSCFFTKMLRKQKVLLRERRPKLKTSSPDDPDYRIPMNIGPNTTQYLRSTLSDTFTSHRICNNSNIQGNILDIFHLNDTLGEAISEKEWVKANWLLDPNYLNQYDEYKRCYAELLYRWGLLNKRIEVLKYISKPPPDHIGLVINSYCQNCQSTNKGAQCYQCKSFTLNCSLCNLTIKGLSQFCEYCGHGGHTLHMVDWFKSHSQCPTGCGCICLKNDSPSPSSSTHDY